MNHSECLAAVNDLAETGWAYRDLLIAHGPLTPETVRLENALHELEQSLAKLRTTLAQSPPLHD